MQESSCSISFFFDKRGKIPAPKGAKNILLHSCCSPCSGEVIEAILSLGLKTTVFFYNPNIHPKKEYELRKEENISLAKKYKIPFIDADYDCDAWFERTKGMELEPERGKRCTVCFDMRFERAALYAYENKFDAFCSCLGISRWKNMAQINDCGHRAAQKYDGLVFWDYNWRKKGGAERMYQMAKEEKMYKQEYCGCAYSLRDTNKWRKENNRDVIRIGKSYYS